MRSVHGLQIHLGIEVRVEENDHVRRSQVDAQTPGARGKKKEKQRTSFFVKKVNALLALLPWSRAVDSGVRVVPPPAETQFRNDLKEWGLLPVPLCYEVSVHPARHSRLEGALDSNLQ